MNSGKIRLNPGEEKRLLKGEPWVYNNEVNQLLGPIQSGEIVSVYSYEGQYIGQGFLNTKSKIFVRLLSRKEEPIDQSFFAEKLNFANRLRIEAGYEDAYRAFFAEADGIPGLIVDKYGDYLAVSFLSLGIDRLKDEIVVLLDQLFHPKGIYERSDSPIREKEGLLQIHGLLMGTVPDWVKTREGDCQFLVDIKSGQKTGTYLDQSKNHLAIIPYCKDKRVLDCFSHAGHFAIQAKCAGARAVTAVDISHDACDLIRRNQQLNNVSFPIVEADVFDFLEAEIDKGNRVDLVILDPPAFTKTKTKLPQAIKGYKQINRQAMRLLEDGGYLVSASCSQHLSLNDFLDLIRDAASDIGKQVQLVDLRIQGQDHPVLLSSETSLYLKFLILRVFPL